MTPRHCLLAALVFFTLMVGIGALPGKAQALSNMVYDKLLHFIAYGLLTGLLYLGMRGRPLSRALRTVLAVALLGAADEALQAAMPYRQANWMDWKFDMLASLSCVLVLFLLHTLRSGLKKAETVTHGGQTDSTE